jgi:hypothetical protein
MMGRLLVAASTIVFAALAISLAPRSAAAQAKPASYGEYRLDAITGSATTVHAGGGITIPAGNYVRVGLIAAAGATRRDGASVFSARTDAIARFTFDPLREMPVALSLGGGVSVPYEVNGTRVRPYLTAVIDVEGRRRGRFTPALQVGLGGGARLGLLLRTSSGRMR